MLKINKKTLDKAKLKSLFTKKSKAINVSFFHNIESRENIKGKTFTIVDFEFSSDYQIYEVAFLDIINGLPQNFYFKEFKLPVGTSYFNLETKRPDYIDSSFNKGKETLTDDIKQYILKRMESADYLVAHNYVAELQCYMKLKFPGQPYDSSKIDMFKNKKMICTNYSFHKKYFNFSSTSNGNISKSFNWSVEIESINKDLIAFNISNSELGSNEQHFVPKNIFSKSTATYHNAMFDIFVTYTNLKTLGYLL